MIIVLVNMGGNRFLCFFMMSNDKIGCQKTIVNFTDAQLTNNLSVCKICTSNIFFSVRRFVPEILTRETALGGPL